MSNKNPLRNEIMPELAFIQSLCSKLFLYPFIGKTKLQNVGYYIVSVLVFCTGTQLFLTLFAANDGDWLEIINVVPNLGVIIMAFIKYMKIHTNGELYEEVLNHFEDDLWNIVTIQSNEHHKIVKNYMWRVMTINRFSLYYSMLIIVLVNSFPYLFMVYENKVHGITSEYLYPFDGWYPFDKVKWFIVVYIWESLMTAIVIAIFGLSNSIHPSYVGLICMELMILGNRVEEVLSPEDVIKLTKRNNVEHIHQNVVRKIKMIVEKHNYLANISSKLDDILGDAMLLNYFLGSIFICLTAFTSTVVDVRYKQIRYFLMCMSLVIEICINCILGQVLSNHSIDFAEAIYFSDWSCASLEAKKLILIFLMRAQKQFQLTGNGYVVMNMNSCSSICSSSYQFYNLLRTIYK